ncbi:hypothetical protein [Alloalcanivorax xenomutans]|jgi:hypothetical protein|uniref:hypothetical protein n=1 Tax=Alloalcanivorax xenomutans TaxID=1094342 RepID=UPI00047CED65
MNYIKLALSITLLLPLLWGCGSDDLSSSGGGDVVQPEPEPGLDISDVELTAEEKALLAAIEDNIQGDRYAEAATDIVALLEAHPDSEQIKRLYSDVLAMQSGMAPSEFAIKVGAVPIQMADENGDRIEVFSSMALQDILIEQAAVEDSDNYRVRFLNGRQALRLRLEGETVSELPTREQADIGVMASIHATRLAYAAVGGAAEFEYLEENPEELESAVAGHLPEVEEELVETLKVVVETSEAVHQHYPIRELKENPVGMSMAKNAFANTMLDDGALSTEEAMELYHFAGGG